LFGTYFFLFCVLLLHLATTCSFLHTSPCCCLLHLSRSAFYCFLPPSCFTLILLDASLKLCLVTTYSLTFHLLLPAPSCFACCYLFLPLCFALLLFTPSFVFPLTTTCSFLCISPCYLPTPFFMFHPTTACSFLYVSPYYYMFFLLCITLPLLVFSFVFHFVTCLLIHTSSCCFYHGC
jgi:hypothetical protein